MNMDVSDPIVIIEDTQDSSYQLIIDYNDDITIGDLKIEISNTHSKHPLIENQTLIFNGRVLTDSSSILSDIILDSELESDLNHETKEGNYDQQQQQQYHKIKVLISNNNNNNNNSDDSLKSPSNNVDTNKSIDNNLNLKSPELDPRSAEAAMAWLSSSKDENGNDSSNKNKLRHRRSQSSIQRVLEFASDENITDSTTDPTQNNNDAGNNVNANDNGNMGARPNFFDWSLLFRITFGFYLFTQGMTLSYSRAAVLIIASALYYFHEIGLFQHLYRRHANNNNNNNVNGGDAAANGNGNERNWNSRLPGFVIDLLGLSVGIPRTPGVVMDVISFFGSFCLSLIPSWDPNGNE